MTHSLYLLGTSVTSGADVLGVADGIRPAPVPRRSSLQKRGPEATSHRGAGGRGLGWGGHTLLVGHMMVEFQRGYYKAWRI